MNPQHRTATHPPRPRPHPIPEGDAVLHRGRHLWNLSNFGLCPMLLLAADTVASLSIQRGNYLPPMLIVWTVGSIIIWRLQRLHICATYVASFVLCAGLWSGRAPI